MPDQKPAATSNVSNLQLPSLKDVHVVVVGDVMLDRYWHGETRRISQEAPVPVLDVSGEEHRPGGAANVALNVVSLGARCTLIGAVGDDDAGQALHETLSAAGVHCNFEVVADWNTIVKLRLISQRQQVLRADFEAPLPDISAKVADRTKASLSGASVLVLEDYDKGVVADPKTLIEQASAQGVPVVVDPKHKPFHRYAGADIVKPNENEFRAVAGAFTDDAAMVAAAQKILADTGIGALVVTRGGRGMSVVEATGAHQHIPARLVDVFDVTGAGDTAAAALAVTRALGWQAAACAHVANVASSIVVSKLGTATASGPEVALALQRSHGGSRGVMSRAQLAEAVTAAKAAGESVVFTNGCFDILHAGHVSYLTEAATLGDRLIVAVNDDASVKRLKGSGRPVNPLDRRLIVLAGLSAVDWVVGFAEDTPEALLELLKPDVLVKGGDYGPDGVVGADIVRGYGGRVQVLSLVEDCSTTAIINRVSGTT